MDSKLMLTNLRYSNTAGGILADNSETGVEVYLRPGLKVHDDALAGAYGPIAAYVPPTPYVPTAEDIKAEKLATPLEPYQFHAMVEIIEAGGRPLNITALINAMPDVTERAVARAKFERSKNFMRNDPLVIGLSAAANLTRAEMDTYWIEALDL